MVKAIKVLVVALLLVFIGLGISIMIAGPGSASRLSIPVVIDFIIGAAVLYGLYIIGSALAKRFEKSNGDE